MNKQTIALGLDVSKRTVDVCLLPETGQKSTLRIPNNHQGFKELIAWLKQVEISQIHACLEPTGSYSRALAHALFEAGILVSLVNSFAVKHHGKSKNFRSKTDRIDAFLLADYGRKHNPPAWTPPPQAHSTLREIQHRLVNLDEQIRQEENRLEAKPESKVVIDDIKDGLGSLYVRRDQLEKEAHNVIYMDELLARNFEILNSMIGIGPESAIRMLSIIRFEKFERGRQVASFVGLAPAKHESGSSVSSRTKISKVGSSELRAALYFPAMVAMQHNPQMRQFAERLRAKGKPPKVIICAVMRKLLVVASALIRNQEMYDPMHGIS